VIDLILGGLVVIALAILYPRFASENPGGDDIFLRAIEIHNKTSFGGEVKQWASCRKILQHVKNPCGV
jgi:hypothetical protein